MEYARESEDPASMSPSPGVGERQGSEQEERSELGNYCFSKRLITFALYGKIHPKSSKLAFVMHKDCMRHITARFMHAKLKCLATNLYVRRLTVHLLKYGYTLEILCVWPLYI